MSSEDEDHCELLCELDEDDSVSGLRDSAVKTVRLLAPPAAMILTLLKFPAA